MGRSALPITNASTVWLSDLIEATEMIATSAASCDPAVVKAFTHRLQMQLDHRLLFERTYPGLTRPLATNSRLIAPNEL
jgi:hypothetical protein